MMEGSSHDTSTDVSLKHLQASKFPLMRRLDQQWALETKLSDYQSEISRVSGLNKAALASIGYQERRLKEMQALLRSTSNQTVEDANSAEHRHERDYTGHNGTDRRKHPLGSSNKNDTNPSIRNHQRSVSNAGTGRRKQLTAIPQMARTTFNRPVVTENAPSHHKVSSSSGVERSIQINDVPGAPTNLRATEIKQESFVLTWDTAKHDEEIIDYEIKYNHSVSGRDEEVRRGCSRWCLKEPVPRGKFVVTMLQPDTEYRDVAIRSRNRIGWSESSESIRCLTTARRDEDYENRRSKFLYRISHIEQSIKDLEATRQQIPAEQVLLSRNMSHMQQRILDLNEEIERVVSSKDEMLSSHLLHGAIQAFTKPVLQRKLEQERVNCREKIAQWRAGIIDMDAESSELAAEISAKESQLKERKAALLKFDRQHSIVSSMRSITSKRPDDLKRYYLASWRSRVENRLEIRKTLDTIARSCRRRIYAGAWHQLCSLVSSRREITAKIADKEVYGIGGSLLNAAQTCTEENLADGSNLIGLLKDIREGQEGWGDENQPGESSIVVDTCPTNLLCKEDKTSLETGDFLFNSGHYESALKHFQHVLSKMECQEYFSGMSSADAAALYSEVNGKIGHCEIALGSFDLALVYFGRQLSLAEEEDLELPETCALMGLGICYRKKHDHQYAESFFLRALDLCLSRRDEEREEILYGHLQKCCECMNRPAEAAEYASRIRSMDITSWNRESGGTAVSRKGVDNALHELDDMRGRLIDVTANKSQLIKLEVVSTHKVLLQKAKSEKEEELRNAIDQLSASKEVAGELAELLEQIEYEIDEAKRTKKRSFIFSSLLRAGEQSVKKDELLYRLREEKKVVGEKHSSTLHEISDTQMLIHNLRDDIKVLKEEIVTEGGPLVQKVLEGRKYRCAATNASNIVCDDVTGMSKNGVEFLAMSEGNNCFVHSLTTGKLQHVFIGDEEGSTATVTALFFYGNRIYAGTMDSAILAWDITTSEKLFTAKGHESAVTCLYADDTKLLSGSADRNIIVWDAENGTLLRRVGGHSRGVHAIQCGPSWCVSASYSTVYVWDIRTDDESGRIKEFNCQCRLVLPNGGNVTVLQYGELEVITGDNLGNIGVWWIEDSELLVYFPVHAGPVASLQVDAVKAVSCGLDMVVAISDVLQGVVLHKLRGHTSPVLAVAFDRKEIISISSDGELRHWAWESPSTSRGFKSRRRRAEMGQIAPDDSVPAM